MKISILKLILIRFLNTLFKKQENSRHLTIFLKRIFGIKPNNVSLYMLAVRHKSKSRVIKGSIKNSNERLEFLGDSILNCIITDILFRKYPYKSEGFLTELRARIVNRNYLNELASKIGINEYIDCSSNFNLCFSKKEKTMLGNALEALVGAIYLDKGYNITFKCIKKLVDEYIELDLLATTETNYKSRLIEFCQRHNKTIIFDLADANNKTLKFTVNIYINEEVIATGVGSNKKDAERQAAEVAYKLIV